MTKIKKMSDRIMGEIDDAKHYAEKYVECKAEGKSSWANKYKEMASDELKHAMYLHEMTVEEIAKLEKVLTPPAEMQEKWDKLHKEYVEKAAWVKQMLMM